MSGVDESLNVISNVLATFDGAEINAIRAPNAPGEPKSNAILGLVQAINSGGIYRGDRNRPQCQEWAHIFYARDVAALRRIEIAFRFLASDSKVLSAFLAFEQDYLAKTGGGQANA
jgi:hypothetical protein